MQTYGTVDTQLHSFLLGKGGELHAPTALPLMSIG
jgi:hypothetical protein